MDPYGTYGSEQGVSYQIPVPKANTKTPTTYKPIPYMNPTYNQFEPVNLMTGQGGNNVDLRNLDSYIDVGGASYNNSAQLADVNSLPAKDPNWPYGPQQSSYTPYPKKMGSSYSGGVQNQTTMNTQRTVAPMEAMKIPEAPKYEGPGEYKPPEEDKGVYKQARREAMGQGMRALREGTREAISSSQSLDNPNARSKFIQQSLKGYGQGLESVAAGAAREGRAEANRKRGEQLDAYRTNFSVKSDNYLRNYQAQVNKIATDFAAAQSAQMANFNASMNQNVNLAGGGTGTPRRMSSSMKKYGFEVLYR